MQRRNMTGALFKELDGLDGKLLMSMHTGEEHLSDYFDDKDAMNMFQKELKSLIKKENVNYRL